MAPPSPSSWLERARRFFRGREPGAPARSVGAGGEDAAARFLEAKGLRVLDRNVRAAGAEIDLVAEAPGPPRLLLIVEVKTRSVASGPLAMLEAVPRAKQARLARAALAYAQARRLDLPIRFDVVAVAHRADGVLEVVAHLEDAFVCDG